MAAAPSSAIRHLAYNRAKRELHVFFRNGGEYTYFDVPAGEYQALVDAPSRGAFLNSRIKGRYRCAPRRTPKRRIPIEPRWPFRETSV